MSSPVPMAGLAERRKAAAVSQQAAGEWIGLTKQGVARIEAGKSRLDVVKARILAERLGCPIESLF